MNHKQRQWTTELYDKGSEFHGHGGPFMVIGLRIGLIALRLLESKGWFGLSCTATLRWSPPDSCVLDGIQVSSGCTMGKRNLIIDEGEGVSAEFKTENDKIKVKLRPEIYDEIKSMLNNNLRDSVENCADIAAYRLMEMGDGKLFSIEK